MTSPSPTTTSTSTTPTTPTSTIPIPQDSPVQLALRKALGGGLSGAAAMSIQVGSLMWLRTTINYQYRHGTTMRESFQILYKEGGIRRFYRGLLPALLQGPLSRFGDTAANTGMIVFLDSYESTRTLPISVKTMAASAAAAGWRMFLMPIDTFKTSMQVSGAQAMPLLRQKFAKHGPSIFYHGALAASAATFVGHFPWFFTYNSLQAWIPQPATEDSNLLVRKLARNAGIGFVATVVSDTASNSVRVVKTYRQTHPQLISYRQAVQDVLAKDGMIGLFGRGLKTKILSNGVQGLLFSVLWKLFEESFNNKMAA